MTDWKDSLAAWWLGFAERLRRRSRLKYKREIGDEEIRQHFARMQAKSDAEMERKRQDLFDAQYDHESP